MPSLPVDGRCRCLFPSVQATYDLLPLNPHLKAILLALAAMGVAGSILLLLLVAAWRRRRQGRAVPRAWYVAGLLAGVVAACGAHLSLAFVGMTVNGGSYQRRVVEKDQVLRLIERRDMWGRSGMCLVWDERGELDLVETGYYADDRKQGTLAFDAGGVGFRDERGKCGPWLFLEQDGSPDRARSGWYSGDQPVAVQHPERFGLDVPAGSTRPLDQNELGDLLLAWDSR